MMMARPSVQDLPGLDLCRESGHLLAGLHSVALSTNNNGR
jgi:hypothetical protein